MSFIRLEGFDRITRATLERESSNLGDVFHGIDVNGNPHIGDLHPRTITLCPLKKKTKKKLKDMIGAIGQGGALTVQLKTDMSLVFAPGDGLSGSIQVGNYVIYTVKGINFVSESNKNHF